MPRKPDGVRTIDKRLEFPLIVGDRTYKELSDDDKPLRNLAANRLGLWGIAGGHLVRIDTHRNRAFFEPLPTALPPRRIWSDGEKVMLSFASEKDSEVWGFTPQEIRKSSVSQAELDRVFWTYSNLRLEAVEDGGFLIDNGYNQETIKRSSEWFFGTQMDKVVKILQDSDKNGFWIATQKSGLIWSRNPF
jgi:hypothetical protein